MNDRDKAIDKIKKLLRMKRGGTVDEIATALRLAEELAAKHGINISDVNPDDDGPKAEQPIDHKDVLSAKRVQCECVYVGMICDQFFKVTSFRRVVSFAWGYSRSRGRSRRIWTYALTFVGTAWDIEIATYVYTFLIRQFRYAWNHKSGKTRNREAFMWGFYIGVTDRLREQMPKPAPENTPALAIINRSLERRNAYIEPHFGKLTSSSASPDHDASAAQFLGFLAGRSTEIRGGMKRNQDERRLLA